MARFRLWRRAEFAARCINLVTDDADFGLLEVFRGIYKPDVLGHEARGGIQVWNLRARAKWAKSMLTVHHATLRGQAVPHDATSCMFETVWRIVRALQVSENTE